MIFLHLCERMRCSTQVEKLLLIRERPVCGKMREGRGMCTKSRSVGRHFGTSLWKFSSHCLSFLSNAAARPVAEVNIGVECNEERAKDAVDIRRVGVYW